MKTYIIADDFTGAGDTAIQFLKNGYHPYFPFSLDQDNNALNDAIVLNTDSRFLSPVSAYELVMNLLNNFDLRKKQVFKKIDSTLRGNPGAEIKAILDATHFKAAIVAPSAPRQGRIVKQGICLVRGRPVHRTEIGKDIRNPLRTSCITDILSDNAREKSGLIQLSYVRKGKEALREACSKLIADGIRIIAVEAVSLDDLAEVAELRDDPSMLFAGSSGLAEFMVKEHGTAAINSLQFSEPLEKILIIVGSHTKTSMNQVRALLHKLQVSLIRLDTRVMIQNPYIEMERIAVTSAQFRESPIVLLTTMTNRKEFAANNQFARESGLTMEVFSEMIASFIARAACSMIDIIQPDILCITGGHTASTVTRTLDPKGIFYLNEILPGIPVGRLFLSDNRKSIPIITKSGGFGNRETFTEIIELLGIQRRTHHVSADS